MGLVDVLVHVDETAAAVVLVEVTRFLLDEGTVDGLADAGELVDDGVVAVGDGTARKSSTTDDVSDEAPEGHGLGGEARRGGGG